jgi:transketolase
MSRRKAKTDAPSNAVLLAHQVGYGGNSPTLQAMDTLSVLARQPKVKVLIPWDERTIKSKPVQAVAEGNTVKYYLMTGINGASVPVLIGEEVEVPEAIGEVIRNMFAAEAAGATRRNTILYPRGLGRL